MAPKIDIENGESEKNDDAVETKDTIPPEGASSDEKNVKCLLWIKWAILSLIVVAGIVILILWLTGTAFFHSSGSSSSKDDHSSVVSSTPTSSPTSAPPADNMICETSFICDQVTPSCPLDNGSPVNGSDSGSYRFGFVGESCLSDKVTGQGAMCMDVVEDPFANKNEADAFYLVRFSDAESGQAYLEANLKPSSANSEQLLLPAISPNGSNMLRVQVWPASSNDSPLGWPDLDEEVVREAPLQDLTLPLNCESFGAIYGAVQLVGYEDTQCMQDTSCTSSDDTPAPTSAPVANGPPPSFGGYFCETSFMCDQVTPRCPPNGESGSFVLGFVAESCLSDKVNSQGAMCENKAALANPFANKNQADTYYRVRLSDAELGQAYYETNVQPSSSNSEQLVLPSISPRGSSFLRVQVWPASSNDAPLGWPMLDQDVNQEGLLQNIILPLNCENFGTVYGAVQLIGYGNLQCGQQTMCT